MWVQKLKVLQASSLSKRLVSGLSEMIERYPSGGLSLLAGILFWYHMRHDPLWVRIVLVLPGTGIFYLGVRGMRRLIQNRFRAPNLTPEIIGASGLLVLLFFLETARWSLWTGAAFLLLILWMIALVRSGSRGGFFSILVGILFLAGCVISYRVLNAGERLLYYALYQYRAGKTPRTEWKEEPGRRYTLTRSPTKLTLALPTDLFFHSAASLKEMVEIPNAGSPLCAVSSSLEDPSIPPLVVIFEVPADESPAQWKAGLDQMFGHLSNLARVENVQFEGDKEFTPEGSSESWTGIFYLYTELSTMRKMRGGVYALPAHAGRRLFFLIREPVTPGFRHHPDLLRMFRGLLWEESKEKDAEKPQH